MSIVSVEEGTSGDNKPTKSFSYTAIQDFSEILTYPPFNVSDNGIHRVVVCDFDGVLSVLGTEVNMGIQRMRVLHDLAQQSDQIVISSSRLTMHELLESALHKFHGSSRRFSTFPFMTQMSQDRLEKFIQRANPNCVVDFHLGLQKLGYGQNQFVGSHLPRLQNGSELIIIGSSRYDRRQVEKLTDAAQQSNIDISNLHYFDTGHRFL